MLLQEIKLVVDHLKMNLSVAVHISSCMHCVKWLQFCSSSLTDSAGKERLLIIYTWKRNPWSYCNNSNIHPSILFGCSTEYFFLPSISLLHPFPGDMPCLVLSLLTAPTMCTVDQKDRLKPSENDMNRNSVNCDIQLSFSQVLLILQSFSRNSGPCGKHAVGRKTPKESNLAK